MKKKITIICKKEKIMENIISFEQELYTNRINMIQNFQKNFKSWKK